MSIAEKHDLTPEELSMRLIVRASGESGYDPHGSPTPSAMNYLLECLQERGLVELNAAGLWVETPAGKAVRP